MATKRLIDANFLEDRCRRQISDDWNKKAAPVSWSEAYKEFLDDVWDAPTVDAVPVDEIRLHHILIDNEGVPETKVQIVDRYFILRTDPVDVRHVVNGNWVYYSTTMQECSNCKRHTARHKFKYCPHCGATMGDKLHYAID